jgi:glycosyltransferase involved in cell wall biosynthesis
MPSDFSVVAIIAAYNEGDIIEQVVSDLNNQGVQVYFMDDGSTDGTVAAVERHLGPGLLGIEHLINAGETGAPAGFDWERVLRRKTQLATELDASWFIHHDADEFRESPWPHLSLRDAIQHVDSLGFNAIDFTGLDFWPVDDRFRAGDNVRDTLTRYTELAPYDRVQVRCWKKTSGLDLTSSGGHEARFPGRKVFPIRFILRHYPIRGQTHGERKVFQERRNRFRDQERARGWHVQYDQLQEGASFLRDPSTLTMYDSDALRLSLTLHPRYPEELEEALGAARSEISANRAEISAVRSEISAVRSEISAARSEIDAFRRNNEAASKHIDHVTAQLTETREELRVRETETVALRRSLQEKTAELAATRAGMQLELDARRAHIAALVEALDRRAAEIERWRTAVDGLTRQLHGFQRSLSWRWTAPARALLRMFKGS